MKLPNRDQVVLARDRNKKKEEDFVSFRWSMANRTVRQRNGEMRKTSREEVKKLRPKCGFQSFEELMAELRGQYNDEKQVVEKEVMQTIKQQRNRMKEKECGIVYPQNSISNLNVRREDLERI